jgi:tripartite-type tricarboxylate transporter receptor subunit TctC
MDIRKLTMTVTGAAVAVGMSAGMAMAQDFPSKPIEVILPMGAGGSHDLTGRVFSSVMPDIMGQPMIIRPMPGGAGIVGQEAFANSEDHSGHTLLYSHNFFDQLQKHATDLPYNTDDWVTVARVSFAPHVLFSQTTLGWKSFQDMVDAINADPGKYKFGHSGEFGATHVPGARILQESGILDKVEFVGFQGGGPLVQAVRAGDVDFAILFPANIGSFGDVVTVLGNGGPKRIFDAPTFGELGLPENLGFMMRIVMAHKDTPAANLAALREAFGQLNDNRTYQRLMKQLPGEDIATYLDGAEYEALRGPQSDAYKAVVEALAGG